MKRDEDLRVTIIGLGHIMETILPILAEAIGPERLRTQVNATTGDDSWREKSERLGIAVRYKDNLQALKDLEPDIIFFAPPPTVAPELIEGELREYVAFCRQTQRRLPAIYALPPMPQAGYYHQALGEDILVAIIIPNGTTSIGGQPVSGEGSNYCVIARPWPPAAWAQLERLLQPLGQTIVLAPEELVPALAAVVMTGQLCWATPLSIAQTLREQGREIGHQALAAYLRARVQAGYGYQPPPGSDPCTTEAVEDPALRQFLDAALQGWHAGLMAYWSQVGLPPTKADEVLPRAMGFRLHVAQRESAETIRRHMFIAATKGGVAERGRECFQAMLEPRLRQALAALPSVPDDAWRLGLQQAVTVACHAVRERGLALAQG